ncbi:MAG: thioredoxin domain-containing protein [Terriglobales bacterium]
MRRFLLLVLAFGLVGLAVAQKAAAPSPGLPSTEIVNAFMKRMFGYDPAVTWQVVEIKSSTIPNVAEIVVRVGNQPTVSRLYVTPDGRNAILGEAMPFAADPFAGIRSQLTQRARGRARGPANAAVTLVAFEDLQCPSCRQAHPILEKLLVDVPNTRLVFQHFPLTAIHKWAFRAAVVSECVANEGDAAFWKFVENVYEHQPEITETNAEQKLFAYAVAAGADAGDLKACVASPEMEHRVTGSLELGRTLGVSATPTVFINGRKVTQLGAIPYEKLKALVQFESTVK